MAKFVFFGVAAHGHFNPTLPVIAELARRGHQVTALNTSEFEPALRAAGADFISYPRAFSSAELAERLRDGNLARAIIISRQATEVLMPFCLETTPALQPDCLVYDAHALWGRITADSMGVPSVATLPHFVLDILGMPKPLGDTLRLVTKYGPLLPELFVRTQRLSRRYPRVVGGQNRTRFFTSGDRNIVFTSPDLQPESALVDDSFVFVGPSIDENVRSGEFPWHRLDHRPLIYVSLGTMYLNKSEFFRRCMTALAGQPVQVVMSIGTGFQPDELGPIPSNCIVMQSVPQLEILKRASLFVSHAGMNSIHESLWYGVPVLAVPQHYEQLLNARTIAARGAGHILEDSWRGRLPSEAEIADGTAELLGNPAYRLSAEAVGSNLRSAGGFRRAADELEAFIGYPRGAALAAANAQRRDPASAAH